LREFLPIGVFLGFFQSDLWNARKKKRGSRDIQTKRGNYVVEE